MSALHVTADQLGDGLDILPLFGEILDRVRTVKEVARYLSEAVTNLECRVHAFTQMHMHMYCM